MEKHKFKHIGKNEGDKNVFMVSCLETGGEFSTEVWTKGKICRNKCPCCEGLVRQ